MQKYLDRLKRIRIWMYEEDISLLMLEDTEGRRDVNIRYFTGHPHDALLFIQAVPDMSSKDKELKITGKTILAAWDENLAKLYAAGSGAIIKSYNDYGRKPSSAIAAISKLLGIPAGSKIEIPSVMPYPLFLELVGELSDFDIICRQKGAASQIAKLRAVKDEEEIAIIKKAAVITNELIDLLEKNVKERKIKTEIEAALFIETEARKRGCEGTSFDTLAAGPDRSFAIHAFPTCTKGQFGADGLSILDFGVKYQGYCTDVTLTFAHGLNEKQEKIVELVEKAYKLALSMAKRGTSCKNIAAKVDSFFAKSKKKMPHSLGHGIGLEEHEYPVLRNNPENEWVLEPGMIFTIEPGLYDPVLGGCRLENDILVTDDGSEVLTNAKIIRL